MNRLGRLSRILLISVNLICFLGSLKSQYIEEAFEQTFGVYCTQDAVIEILAYLPNPCYEITNISTSVSGYTITITFTSVYNDPSPGVCPQNVVYFTEYINLGNLPPGNYNFTIQGENTYYGSFPVWKTQNCIEPGVINPGKACPGYSPVCGCDGVTYDNICTAFYKYGVTDWTSGVCPDPCVANPPSVSIAGPATVCHGDTATLTAQGSGGTPGYSYLWSTGQTTNPISTPALTAPATYTVTLTDDNGCTASSSVVVGVAPEIVMTNFTINGLSGSFTLSGGLPQVDGSNYSSVTMTNSLTSNMATLTTMPFTHGAMVNFEAPEAGWYFIVAGDNLGCVGLGVVSLGGQDTLPPCIEWQKTIGGNSTEEFSDIHQTIDGGYILGGHSDSGISGDKTESSQGGLDYWVVKLDPAGNIQWQNTIGGSNNDQLTSIQQTSDGGYILGGYSGSGISGDKTESSQGGLDYWVVKLDPIGNIEWQNTIGGGGNDILNSTQQSTDGGYILGGYSFSDLGGDKTENNKGNSDYWVVKLDALGNIVWQNTIGGNKGDILNSIQLTTDGGYIVGGTSSSDFSSDKAENSLGFADYWVVKLDALGNIEWENTIGGSGGDGLYSLQQTTDGGYILGGESVSDISGDKTENSQGLGDYWIVKLNTNGGIQWQNTIGGNNVDQLFSIQESTDGGYLLGGTSFSGMSGDKTENSRGQYDYWIVKLDAIGNIRWQKTIGGSNDDLLFAVDQTIDEKILLGGWSSSDISGDKIENSKGFGDYWVLMLSPYLVPTCQSLLIFPSPNSTNISIDTSLTWPPSPACIDGYYLTLSTTPNGNDLLNHEDVGNTTSYQPAQALPAGDTIYVRITPYNSLGEASNCPEFWFVTKDSCVSGQSLACDAQYTLYLDTSCQATILPEDVLVGAQPYCYDHMLLTIDTLPPLCNGPWVAATVTSAHAGNTYCYRVQDTVAQFQCWGDLTILNTGIPECSALTTPAPGTSGNSINTSLAWAAAAGCPAGYRLSLGTSPGGTDILDNLDVGNSTGYQPAQPFPVGDTIYVSITPYNSLGDAVGCQEFWFGTAGANCTFNCQDQVTVEIPATVDIDMLLEGLPVSVTCPNGVISIELYDQGNQLLAPGNSTQNIGCAWLGDTLQAVVVDAVSGHSCSTDIVVKDDNGDCPPVTPDTLILSISDATVAKDEMFCLDVTVANFDSVVSMQCRIAYDPVVFGFEAIQNITLPNASLGNFNTAIPGEIRFSWTDQTLLGVNLPDAASIFQVCLNAIAPGCDTSLVQFAGSPNFSLEFLNKKGAMEFELFPGRVSGPPLPAPTISGNPVLCSGSATLTVSGNYPTPPQWSNNATGLTIIADTAGLYTVTVTAANGCTATASQTVAPGGPAPTPSISGSTALCSGAATLTVSGNYPIPPQWSNNATGLTIIADTAGLYTVTVTAANGCTATATQTITPGGPAPTPTISGSTTLCSGSATLTVSGNYPTPPQWSNNATGLTITADTAGLYTVTVTAANGCTATATQTITPGGPAPTPQITGNLMPCTGSSTVLSAGAYAAYAWTGNQSGPTLTVNAPGNYTVTVTDANGCTGTDQAQVDFLPAPSPTTMQTPDYCNQTNGSIQLNVGGPGPFGFLWSTGSSSQNLTNISAGTYTVTVTGQGNCSATATASVAAVAGPSVSSSVTPATCGQTDGAVALGISGGTPNFTFLWNTGATAQNLTAVPAGTYTVTVTDAAGCSQTTTANVPGPPALATGIIEEDCGGGDAVYIVRFPISGGTPPYTLVSGTGTITGNQFESQPIFSGVNYSFSISDAAGCPAVMVNGVHSCSCVTDAGSMDSAPLVVCGNGSEMAQHFPGQPLPPSAVLRFALHLGSGNQLQNVLAWSATPEFGFSSNGMVYGATYYISAVAGQDDGFGNVNLADPCLDVSVGTPVRFFPGYSGNTWAVICQGESYSVGNETFNTAGSYTVTLQSIHGCDSVVILDLEVRNPQVVLSKDTTICAGQAVTLSAQSSGCNGCKYSWSVPGVGNSIQLNPVSSDVYQITATDNQGCTATASASVQVVQDTVVEISAVICEGGSYEVGPQIFTTAGDYTVHLNSLAGCDSTVNLFLEVMEARALKAVGDTVFYPPGQGISERVFDVAANDSLFGAAWRIRITQQPQAGQADSTDDGRFLRYRLLDPAFRGIDVLEYELCDADCQGPCTRARVFVVVQDDIENVADSLVNTITPNGDGFNDVFDPLQEYLDQQYIVPVKQATLSIFNRWGERVFHTDGNYEPWDGSTGNSGRKVPQGAYYYVLQLDVGEKIVVRGTVHVFGTE